MALKYTYQQNRMNEDILFCESTPSPETGILMVQASNDEAAGMVVGGGEMVSERKEAFIQPVVRRNLVQREKLLLVGNSRYVEPRHEVDLVASLDVHEGLHLPQRPVQHVNYDWITVLLLVSLGLFSAVK